MGSNLFVVDVNNFSCVLNEQGKEGDCAVVAPSVASYLFDYDLNIDEKKLIKGEDIKYSINPFSYSVYNGYYKKIKGDIVFIKDNHFKNRFCNLVENKSEKDNIHNLQKFIESFNAILYCCNEDYHGARAYSQFFTEFLAYGELYNFKDVMNQRNIKLLSTNFFFSGGFVSLEEKSISESSFLNIEGRVFKQYKKKDYGEFIFNSYSNIYFSDIMRLLNIREHSVITQRALSILIYLKEENPISKNGLLAKNSILKNIEFNSNAYDIIKSLIKDGLISEVKQSYANDLIMLSKKGELFLDYIHEDFNEAAFKALNSHSDDLKGNLNDYYDEIYYLIVSLFEKQNVKQELKVLEFYNKYIEMEEL